MTIDYDAIAERAYLRWGEALGMALPPWFSLTPNVRQAWRAAVVAARESEAEPERAVCGAD